MNIAHISYFFRPIRGGQEVYIDNLNKILVGNGLNISVYQRNFEGEANFDDIQPIHYPAFLEKYARQWNWHFFTLFAYLFKRKNFRKDDVIITHYAVHSPSVWRFKNKVIVLSHGVEWNTERKKMSDRVREYIAKKSFNRFTIVANDTHYFRYLGLDTPAAENFFKEVAPRKWFIPNCVDHTVFKRNNGLPELSGKKIILVPRMITQDRGIDLAIEAFNNFQSKIEGFMLYIVGGPRKGKYFEQCIQLTKKYNIEKSVIFYGLCKNEDMPSLYSSAILTLIPTLRREGTSLSALESMACKTPTVSTNVVGLRDLPTVQANPKPIDLSNKMLEVIRNREAIANDQYNKVVTIFNMRNWEKAWLKVINETYNS